MDPFRSDAGAELASQLSLIRQPSPPPVAALVQNLPHTSHSATAASIPPWKVADPFPGPISTVPDESKQSGAPKQLYIVTSFIKLFSCSLFNGICLLIGMWNLLCKCLVL